MKIGFLLLSLILISCNPKEEKKTTSVREEAPPIQQAPSSLVYTQNNLVLFKDSAIVPVNPSFFGFPNNFTISPSLPLGLSFNSTNGIISGTPLIESPETTYTIIAGNSQGFSQTTIKVTIKASIPKLLSSEVRNLDNNNLFYFNGSFLFGDNVLGGRILSLDLLGISVLQQFDGLNSYTPSKFYIHNSQLYVVAEAQSFGVELFKYNGTNFELVKDVFFGSNPSNPDSFISEGSYLYFIAEDETGRQLWRTDGTSLGTIKLTNSLTEPRFLTSLNNSLVFLANSPSTGEELFKTEGSDISLIQDIDSSSTSSNVRSVSKIGNNLYFRADDGINYGSEIYKSDGNTILFLHDINPGLDSSGAESFIAYQDKIYFSAFTPSSGRELFRMDGNSFELVSDISTGVESSFPSSFFIFKDSLYFLAFRSDVGQELFKYDGNTLSLVLDLNTGPFSSNIQNIHIVGDFVYFTAQTPAQGRELYRMNENSQIVLIQDFTSGPESSFFNNFVNINNQLYFILKNNETEGLYFIAP